MNYPEEVLFLFDDLIEHCSSGLNICGILLVGSYATGDFSHSEDVDLVVLSHNPKELLENPNWVNKFGTVLAKQHQKFGPIEGLKVKYADKEVDFGITTPNWASITPLDEKTKTIIRNGAKIIYDPQEHFKNLLEKMY